MTPQGDELTDYTVVKNPEHDDTDYKLSKREIASMLNVFKWTERDWIFVMTHLMMLAFMTPILAWLALKAMALRLTHWVTRYQPIVELKANRLQRTDTQVSFGIQSNLEFVSDAPKAVGYARASSDDNGHFSLFSLGCAAMSYRAEPTTLDEFAEFFSKELATLLDDPGNEVVRAMVNADPESHETQFICHPVLIEVPDRDIYIAVAVQVRSDRADQSVMSRALHDWTKRVLSEHSFI